MGVPFIDLGPGQSARLVWQVLGKNGPVFNPNGIKYLPPDAIGGATADAGRSPSGVMDIASGLSGVNVLLSAGTLVVSLETLAEVRRISTKVDSVLIQQRTTNRKIDQMLEKLGAIEVKVGEGRLATIVDHALRAAAHGSNEVSFAPLAELAHDLEGFISDSGIVRGRPATLRLGSDLRGGLRRLFLLLRGVRLHVARSYNRTCEDADSAWVCHPYIPYGQPHRGTSAA